MSPRNHLAVLVHLVLVLAPHASVNAQSYSADEAALLRRMNDCWQVFVDTWERWYDECVHPDMYYWNPTVLSPKDARYFRRTHSLAYEAGVRWLLADLRPHRVTIHGDLAMVFLSGTWGWRSGSGEFQQEETVRLEVWKRENGRWLLLSGLAAPAAANH